MERQPVLTAEHGISPDVAILHQHAVALMPSGHGFDESWPHSEFPALRALLTYA